MFTITANTIVGLVVGFALGVLVYYAYDKLMYEIVEEDEKPTTEKMAEQQPEPKGEPRTFGRSCQNFASAMNGNSGQKCQYLNQASGYCNHFNKSVYVLGGKYERLAECKDTYG